MQENAGAISTDLPETYEIPPTETPISEVEKLGDTDIGNIPEIDVPADTDAGIVPEVEVMVDAGTTRLPEVEIIGTTTETQAESGSAIRPQTDSDADGVLDDEDQCPESASWLPGQYGRLPRIWRSAA